MSVSTQGLLTGIVMCLAGAASAQVQAPPSVMVAYHHDTGWIHNTADSEEVVASFPVRIDGAGWLLLYFDDVVMDAGSTLRITSLTDGAVQTMKPIHLRQWEMSTAYFNGDEVLVEVLAAASATPHRVVLKAVEAGYAPTTDTQCGPTDDRVLSFDNRNARALPIGCTAWVISDCGKCFITAGHCLGGTQRIEFNVPLSQPSGVIVHPAPEDQYFVDPASTQSQNNGQGNDWGYFGVFRNTNTGLTPYEAYGMAYDLLDPPPDGTPATINITGYGVDSSPPEWNQVQQTHDGPLATVNGTFVSYQTDTQGGNSGSPVFWVESNAAIAVHGYGGCSTSGTGANSGTGVNHTNFVNARNNPTGVCATQSGTPFEDLASSLAGTTGTPNLSGTGTMAAGSPFNLDLVGAAATSTAFLVVGFTRSDTPFAGGSIVPTINSLLAFPTDGSGEVHLSATWPPGLPSCSSVYLHAWVVDAGGPLGFAASNAVLGLTP